MADKKSKKKKNITEKIIKKIKNYAGSIEDFLEGSTTTDGSYTIGKQEKWGVEKSSGGLIKGKPKLAKRGWK